MSGSIGWGREDDDDDGDGGVVVVVGLGEVGQVRSEWTHERDTGVWCDPLAVDWMDSGQLWSCLSRLMQDAGRHGANKSQEVRMTLPEKFTGLNFSALQVDSKKVWNCNWV